MGIKIPKIAFIKFSINDVTGIGLFLVKQICDQYNIDIRISSDCVKNINGIPCGYFMVELIF